VPGKAWWCGFLSRHPDLRPKTPSKFELTQPSDVHKNDRVSDDLLFNSVSDECHVQSATKSSSPAQASTSCAATTVAQVHHTEHHENLDEELDSDDDAISTDVPGHPEGMFSKRLTEKRLPHIREGNRTIPAALSTPLRSTAGGHIGCVVSSNSTADEKSPAGKRLKRRSAGKQETKRTLDAVESVLSNDEMVLFEKAFETNYTIADARYTAWLVLKQQVIEEKRKSDIRTLCV